MNPLYTKTILFSVLGLFIASFGIVQAAPTPRSTEFSATEVMEVNVVPVRETVRTDSSADTMDGDPDRPVITGEVSNTKNEEEPVAPRGTETTDIGISGAKATQKPSQARGTETTDIGFVSDDKTYVRAGFMKLGDIKGESDDSGSASRSGYLKIDDIRGESNDSSARGNAETTWKVEKGEKSARKPKEIVVVGSKVAEDKASVKLTLATCDGANFVCKSSDVQNDDDLLEFAERHLNEGGVNEIRFEDRSFSIRYSRPASLFGFIPINLKQTAEVAVNDNEFGRVKVRFPWWSFMVKKSVLSGETGVELQKAITSTPLSKWEAIDFDASSGGDGESSVDLVKLNPQPDPPSSTGDEIPVEEVTLNFAEVKASFLDTLMSIIRK
jgi:hypothetical protein